MMGGREDVTVVFTSEAQFHFLPKLMQEVSLPGHS